jgi:periplasmic copper chaperone A
MKQYFRSMLFLAIVFVLTACAAQARQTQVITIDEPWARPGVAGGNSAVYFVIQNPSDQADILIDAESDVAEFVELHMTSMDANGNMQMQHQESVSVGAGSNVEFVPGGLHVMLIQLHENLAVGETIPLTLHFENTGSISIEATVMQP